jgi:drug/metabolite transporter (DMT)-like permease
MVKEKINHRTLGILAFIFLASVYAGTGVITRSLDAYFTTAQQLILRILIAFVFGLFLFKKQIHFKKMKKITGKEWALIIIRTFASFVFGAMLWVKATTLTKLANVTFIDSLPITAILTFLFSMEKVSFKKIFYIILSVLGVLILSLKDYSNLLSFGFGELLVLLSGFFFAFRNISRRWQTKLLNDLEISMLMFFFSFFMLLLVSLFLGEKWVMPSVSPQLIVLLLFGGITMGLNIVLGNYGFANVPLVLGNNLLNLEALFGIIFGLMFFGELVTFKELVGGILIVFSVIKMNEIEK